MASVREAKEQLGNAGDDVATAANESVASMKDEIHKLRAKLRANGEDLEDNLRDAGERFAEGARTFSTAAVEQIREHPLAAFGVAFSVGVVVSRWLRKR